MANTYARRVHVIQATKDGQTEHWAAAADREDAVAIVRKLVGAEWSLVLTDDRPLSKQLAKRMRHNTVRKLEARDDS